jgi:nucleotide-binding universal stress UspA family protein
MAEIVRVLSPTDFSAAADRASRRAASVASTLNGTLHLMHVLPPQEVLDQLFPAVAGGVSEPPRAYAERALDERAQRIAAQFNITPTCHLVQGRAHEAVVALSASLRADVVVLGAQGEREGVLASNTVGDTALKIAAQSQMPALLVRTEQRQPYAYVVGCVKGDQADPFVIQWTNRVSPADLIHILHVYTVPYERRLRDWGASPATLDAYSARERARRTQQLSGLLNEIGLPSARARLHVERGEPGATILQTAAQWQADLIIVGRRTGEEPFPSGPIGRSRLQRRWT